MPTPDDAERHTRLHETTSGFSNQFNLQGNWTHQFEVKKTKSKDFYLNDKDTIKLPTMTQMNTFKYGESEELDAKVSSFS